MSIIDHEDYKDLKDLAEGIFTQARDNETKTGDVWAELTELGLARLTGPESVGGSEAGWGEAATLASAAAAAGVPIPYVETDLLSAWLLDTVGLESCTNIRTVAQIDDDGYAQAVPWAVQSERFVLIFGDADSGWKVAKVKASDVTTSEYPAFGREPRANITVSDVVMAQLREPGNDNVKTLSTAQYQQYLLRGALARSLQVVAALETATELAKEHVVTRNQFGRPLAKFQSVQNLIVDAVAETALARSAVDQALQDALDTDLGGPLSVFRVAVAKSVVGRAASVAVRNTHQALGAIGTTEEHSLHKFTNAAETWRSEYGAIRSWELLLGQAATAGTTDDVWALVVEGAQLEGALH